MYKKKRKEKRKKGKKERRKVGTIIPS